MSKSRSLSLCPVALSGGVRWYVGLTTVNDLVDYIGTSEPPQEFM